MFSRDESRKSDVFLLISSVFFFFLLVFLLLLPRNQILPGAFLRISCTLDGKFGINKLPLLILCTRFLASIKKARWRKPRRRSRLVDLSALIEEKPGGDDLLERRKKTVDVGFR